MNSSQPHLTDFLLNILKNIGYGILPTSNRAYQWMKSNNNLNSSCLNYLKDNISEENFISIKEMNLYKDIAKKKNIPKTEEEVDLALSSYIDLSCDNSFENINIDNLENELEYAKIYLKELQSSEKMLLRYSNKLDAEIEELNEKKLKEEHRIDDIIQRSNSINESFNMEIEKVEHELLKTESILMSLPETNPDQYNLFQIDFEVLKKINFVFRETVTDLVDKKFSKLGEFKNLDIGEQNDCINTEEKIELSFEDTIKENDRYADLINVALNLGRCIFQRVNLKCEETKLCDQNNYIKDLINECNPQKPITLNRLQSQIAFNIDTVNDTQKKVNRLRHEIENYYNNHVLDEIFLTERLRIIQKIKSDKKRFRKISELCSEFVNLITLQACLLENEKNNVNMAMLLHRRTCTKLKELRTKHNDAIIKLNSMLQNQSKQNIRESCENTIVSLVSSLLKIDENKANNSIVNVTQKCENMTNETFAKIMEYISNNFKHFGILKHSIRGLDEVIFDGPARQPFLASTLPTEKMSIEKQYHEFCKIFKDMKAKYQYHVKELSTNEGLKLQKSLWIKFLTDPKKLQEEYEQMSQKASVNKTVIETKKNETLSRVVKSSSMFN